MQVAPTTDSALCQPGGVGSVGSFLFPCHDAILLLSIPLLYIACIYLPPHIPGFVPLTLSLAYKVQYRTVFALYTTPASTFVICCPYFRSVIWNSSHKQHSFRALSTVDQVSELPIPSTTRCTTLPSW